MSVIGGPKIIITGRIAHLDISDPKSFQGLPTTNLCGNPSTYYTAWTNSGTGSVSGNDTIVSRLFPNATVMSVMVIAGPGNIQLAPGFAPTITTSTTYTVSTYIFIPQANSASIAGSPPYCRPQPDNNNRGTLEYDGSNNWSSWPRNQWIRVHKTFTTQPVSSSNMYISSYLNNTNDRIYYTAPQIEQLPYLTPWTPSSRNGIADISGLGNHGVIVGHPTHSNNALVFNGTSSSVVYIPDSTTLKLSGDKSLVTWVNLAADNSGCGIAGKSSSTSFGMALGYGWSTRGFMALAWNSANAPYLEKDLNRDIGKWVYLAAIQSGSTRFIYALDADGMRSSSYSGGTHTWDNTEPLMIGNANSGSNFAPAGTKIAMVSVYNRPLTETEIMVNFSSMRSRFGI